MEGACQTDVRQTPTSDRHPAQAPHLSIGGHDPPIQPCNESSVVTSALRSIRVAVNLIVNSPFALRPLEDAGKAQPRPAPG